MGSHIFHQMFISIIFPLVIFLFSHMCSILLPKKDLHFLLIVTLLSKWIAILIIMTYAMFSK